MSLNNFLGGGAGKSDTLYVLMHIALNWSCIMFG